MAKKRILIADDEQHHRENFKRYFESLGYKVDTAQSYISVREFLDNHNYALIVSDNRMPLSDGTRPDSTCGLQLLAWAKTGGQNKNTPFVLNTSDYSDGTKELVAKFGGIYRHKADITTISEFFAPLLSK